MAATAVSLYLGIAFFHLVVASGAGDLLAGAGQLLVGLAALVAILLNNRKTRDVQAATAQVAATTAQVAEAVGPVNGRPMNAVLYDVERRLTDHISEFKEYQRTRNHDVLNALTAVRSTTPTLITLSERILAEIRQQKES